MTPSDDLRYKNFFVLKSWKVNYKDDFERKTAFLDDIFNIIVLISMGLCFFSLSSSMSANIYDQSREISVMLSFGCTKFQIMKMYIYESLIIVISSSISGFCIGILIGNFMMVQQCMFQGAAYRIELPIY